LEFWFILAGHLGKSVAETQRTVTSREFTYWKAFHNINPIGQGRGDLQAAIVARTVAQTHAPKNKVFKLSEFMPKFRGKSRPTVEQLTAKLMTWFNVNNGSN
jgi:hypothetical protein